MTSPIAGAQVSQPTTHPTDEAAADKVDRELQEVFASEGEAQFLVLFEERADTSAASAISDWEERGRFVYETLTRHAEQTQAAVIADLDALGVDYQPYWIVNTVLVTGSSTTASALARHSEVESIVHAADFEIPTPEHTEPANSVAAASWGLDAINIPEVWAQYGARGDGIVVGVLDSGAQWDHPALINSYRGALEDGSVDHEYNWYDPTRYCGDPSPEPCDLIAHGTHVTGTVAGDDGGENQIGVAPEVTWISAVGCDIVPGFCSTEALLGAGQWMAAPTDTEGNNPDPDMRPHIINNSWGGDPGDAWYKEMVDNWLDFGMFPQFASGNSGPACGTAGSPGDYSQSYSTGGFDVNGNVYVNSGRGPSALDGGIKPNISAPAVDVRSSVPGDAYANFTGTSMASPHVAGAVAVIWSAAPALIGDVDATKELLDQTAVDTEDLSCGGEPGNNNVFGEGKLDVLAAMQAAPVGAAGIAEGIVTDASDNPIEGATVAFAGDFERSIETATDGTYSVVLPVGDYDATASADGFLSESAEVTVAADTATTRNFSLEAVPSDAIPAIDEAPSAVERRETVTLIGGNFVEPLEVSFGSETLNDVDVLSETELTFDVPNSARFGDYVVTVTTPVGVSNGVTMTVVQPGGGPSVPVITSAPDQVVPGETVTLKGGGFRGQVRVRFGDTTISDVNVISESELTFVVPDDAQLGPTTTSVRAQGRTSNSVVIDVVEPVPELEIVTTELPVLHVLQHYDATVEASGGVPPYTWSAEGLSPGLVLDAGTGTITNDPQDPAITDANPADVTLTVTDDRGSTATAVVPLDPISAVTVGAGSYHTCAIDSDGATWCWGQDLTGQLGDGEPNENANLPVKVAGDHEFVSVTAGGEHTCALDTTGAAWCWGRNHNGQLGDDNLGVDSPEPVAVSGGHEFIILDTGFANTCGIDTDNVAWCWGADQFGQLGHGGTGDPVPVPTMVGDGEPFHASTIATGSHTCALAMGGDAWCWGYNASGQLGTGPGTSAQPLPVAVAGDHTFTSLVTGQNHTCGIDDGGTSWCWGDNAAGQLGLGHFFENNYIPMELTDVPAFATLRAHHGNSTCGITISNGTWCWGSNNFGQLGRGDVGGSNSASPVPVAGDHAFTAVPLGEFHTCGVDNSGVVRCWGANFSGQLGKGDDGFGTESGQPRAVHPGTPIN